MARRIKIVPGGHEEFRKDGEQPEFFHAQHLIPFGNKKDLGSKLIGIFNVDKDEIPDEHEKLVSKADSYANDMKAPFYELNFKRLSFPKKWSFRINPKKINVTLTGEIQLYVHNRPAQIS